MGVGVVFGVTEGVGAGVADGVGVGVGDDEGAGVVVVADVGFGSNTPLFQANFLPDFIQVYFLPEEMLV